MKFQVGDKVLGISADIKGCEGIIEHVTSGGHQHIRITKAGFESWQGHGEWAVGSLLNRDVDWTNSLVLISRNKGGDMATLKPVTTFIKTLKKPIKDYYRLGWVEVQGDDLVVTDEGLEAFARAKMVEGLSIETYAEQEIARLKKQEKESNED